jgi:two-component system, NarL family, invasion response regulator UvrY
MIAKLGVLLVDDHAVVREGYRRLLEATGSISVVAEADSGETAYASFVSCAPDVVVMDISLPGIGGLEALRRIRAREPAARVLMFSMHEDPVFVERALDGGASGYVTKASAPDMLVQAVQTIASGGRFLSGELARRLVEGGPGDRHRRLDVLTEREFEVLRLLTDGRSLSEIAVLLCVSGKTVANYQTSIRQKLGADNPMQLLRLALACGLTAADRTTLALAS